MSGKRFEGWAVTIHTDQFGRVYERLADFAPAVSTAHIPLYETSTDRYLGALTRWRDVGWTHSLHRFGEPALADLGTALHAFMERAGLKCAVHLGREG